MRKLIIAMMIAISSLSAGTVGANSDGKIMNKAYLDIAIGDEVNYQYVTNNGAFEMYNRKLNKVFDLYKQRGLNNWQKASIMGKLSLPKGAGEKVTLMTPKYTGGDNDIKLYINGTRIIKKNTLFKPLVDSMGNKYLDFKIDMRYFIGDRYRGIDNARKFVNQITFKVSYQSKQTGRGGSIKSKTAIPTVYCLEE